MVLQLRQELFTHLAGSFKNEFKRLMHLHHDCSVYGASVYDASVYDASVYDASVFDAFVYDACVVHSSGQVLQEQDHLK